MSPGTATPSPLPSAGADRWAVQSEVSDPGPHAPALDDLSGDPGALRDVVSGLVFHYRAGGDLAENGIDEARLAEIDLRSARRILDRLRELADRPLDHPRRPAERVLGCCRDFTLLLLTLARHHGIPARARVGFAAYFIPGWYLDHVVVEIWDAGAGRWRLMEPQLQQGFADADTGRELTLTDVPRDRFLTGAAAWRACRDGRADPERFVVDPRIDQPVLRSWPYLAHNLIHDLASLNRREMLLWDVWGAVRGPGPYPSDLLDLLDGLAAATGVPDPDPDVLAQWLDRPEFRIPDQVTSHSPVAMSAARVPVRPGPLPAG